MVLLPFLILCHEFDLVFVECRDQQIKLIQFFWKRPETDAIEVKRLLSHIFEHPVEGKMIMLSQTQFEEVLFLFPKFGFELVKESDEELYVALLATDGQCFLIFSTLSVVMCNSLRMRIKHTQEDKERTDHHTSTAFSSFAMDNDNWLTVLTVSTIMQISGQHMVLLHSLEEETCIEAELEDFLNICHVMVWKGEPAQTEILDRLLWICILLFST